MRKYTTYVGMDVHARSIESSAVDVTTGEVFNRSFGGCPRAVDVAGWLSALPQPVYCAYVSGCTGFVLARGLRELGYDCDVIAVSTLPRSAKDRKQKCDRNIQPGCLFHSCLRRLGAARLAPSPGRNTHP